MKTIVLMLAAALAVGGVAILPTASANYEECGELVQCATQGESDVCP